MIMPDIVEGMTRLTHRRGDITREHADAIVNAANSGLLGGGGVDGAIHRAAGPALLAECRVLRERQGPVPTGGAVATTAGRLNARYVIHAVGPRWLGGSSGEEELLADAYRNSLSLALERGCRTVAFPSLSTGIYGFPGELAAPIAVRTVRNFLREHPGLTEVVFVTFSSEDERMYERVFSADTA